MAVWSIVKVGSEIPESLATRSHGYKIEGDHFWFSLSVKNTTKDLINGSLLKIGKRKLYRIQKK